MEWCISLTHLAGCTAVATSCSRFLHPSRNSPSCVCEKSCSTLFPLCLSRRDSLHLANNSLPLAKDTSSVASTQAYIAELRRRNALVDPPQKVGPDPLCEGMC